MKDFFNAKSIVVIGASRNPKKLGHVVLENMLNTYNGEVYVVNKEASFIMGKKCYNSISDIADKIELAVIIVPAKMVPDIVSQCSKKGVKSCIILSSGFGEIGNKKSEEKILKNARKMRILGPNCMGIYDSLSGIDTLFTKRYRQERPKKGNISLISQSGAIGAIMLDTASSEHIKMAKFISIGNRIDVDEIESLEFLEKDNDTKTIALYIEGIKNGKDFTKIMKKIKKPLIVLKAGKTKQGTKAAESHTTSLAGEPSVYSAIFRQTGAIEAMNIDEIMDFSKIMDSQPLPKGRKVQIITNGGGLGIIALDSVIENGLDVAELSSKTRKNIKDNMPEYVTISNPIDLNGDADPKRYKISIESALKDNNVDALLLIVLFQFSTLDSSMISIISDAKKYKKPIVLCSSGGEFTELYKRVIEDSGIPVYPTPNRASKALSAIVKRAEFLGKIK